MIGVVCGMASELRALGGWASDDRVAVAVSGARPDQASALADRLAAGGARMLVSWGIAGGLDPALATGALVVPDRVVLPEGSELPLAARMLHRVPGGVLAGSDTVVTSAESKATLRDRTGAVAVDMETHRVAEVAVAHAIPCVAVRAVSDPADRALPALAASALSEDGRPMIGRVLTGLVRRPWELPDLIRAGRDSKIAHAMLRGAADTIFTQLLDDTA